MKTLIVEDRPDYLKVLYVSAFFIDYWGTHFESFTFRCKQQILQSTFTVSLISTAQIKIIVRVYLW